MPYVAVDTKERFSSDSKFHDAVRLYMGALKMQGMKMQDMKLQDMKLQNLQKQSRLESCAIAKMTAQCAIYMGALKTFGTP